MIDTSTAPTRRQRRREATIAEILDAARAQMRQDGAAALNLHEVARRVGMRTPSLYEYFPGGKHALLDALFRMGIERLAVLTAPAFAIADPTERLYQGMVAYLRFAVETPELFQICYERPVPDFVPSTESLTRSFELLGALNAMSAQLVADLPNPFGLTADQAQNLILAVSHGIAALHLANEPHLPVGEGRFGSLLPIASAVLTHALTVPSAPIQDQPATGEQP